MIIRRIYDNIQIHGISGLCFQANEGLSVEWLLLKYFDQSSVMVETSVYSDTFHSRISFENFSASLFEATKYVARTSLARGPRSVEKEKTRKMTVVKKNAVPKVVLCTLT